MLSAFLAPFQIRPDENTDISEYLHPGRRYPETPFFSELKHCLFNKGQSTQKKFVFKKYPCTCGQSLSVDQFPEARQQII